MSLRDDLEQLFSCTGRDTRYTEEWQEPYLRLRAALTPAAIKWLEALPGLLEFELDAHSGPWAMDYYICVPGDTPGQFHIFEKLGGDSPLMSSGMGGEGDARLIVKLRNALHEAARLHADESALNAQDNKEQK